MTWIALLRGINVSGQRPVPMARLRVSLDALDLRDVRTYVQSGNVVFTAAVIKAETLETALARDFGFAIPVVLRTAAEFRTLVRANPFPDEPGIDPTKLHVTFLATAPAKSALPALGDLAVAGDAFHLVGREIYLHCPNGYGRTKLTNALFERKLGVGATTRNWKTVTTLNDMAAE